jgi:hypothetical protein
MLSTLEDNQGGIETALVTHSSGLKGTLVSI